MSDPLDLDALAEVARKATTGDWEADHGEENNSSVKVGGTGWWDGLAYCGKAEDAEHIATFDPPTVLALLARVEEAEGARDEWERQNTVLTKQRDAAVAAIADAWDQGYRVHVSSNPADYINPYRSKGADDE